MGGSVTLKDELETNTQIEQELRLDAAGADVNAFLEVHITPGESQLSSLQEREDAAFDARDQNQDQEIRLAEMEITQSREEDLRRQLTKVREERQAYEIQLRAIGTVLERSRDWKPELCVSPRSLVSRERAALETEERQLKTVYAELNGIQRETLCES